jgi:hypothetical protein
MTARILNSLVFWVGGGDCHVPIITHVDWVVTGDGLDRVMANRKIPDPIGNRRQNHKLYICSYAPYVVLDSLPVCYVLAGLSSIRTLTYYVYP